MTTGWGTRENFRYDFGAARTDIWKGSPIYRPSGVPIDWAVVALATLVVLAIGLIPPELMTAFGVHYVRPGGSFYEKLHPATYLVLATFVLLLMRSGDPIGEIDRIASNAKLLLVHFFACGLLVFQCIMVSRPFTSVIDTFLLPIILSLIVWSLTPAQRKPMVVAVHVVIWINIALGFYEYFSKHRLVPMWIGNIVVTGDWRSTALLGHPLSAAAIVAMYIIALALGPKAKTQSPLLTTPALIVATCSLMVFGGRMALAAVIFAYAGLVVAGAFRLVRGERFGLPSVIIVACGIILIGGAVTIALGTGAFDNIIGRFSSDKGSAYARITTMHLLSLFDWNELLLGPTASHTAALQSLMGLQAGIENFWIASIVQYGIIQTTLITIGLACFVVELLRRSAPAARVAVLFICVIAAGSVSFSSKNITLSAYVALILLLLPGRDSGLISCRPLGNYCAESPDRGH